MQLKEVATLLGVENKEVISELEARRAEFSAKGLAFAKKLNAASALDQELAKLVLASFDVRRQQAANEEKAMEEKRRRAEEERRREADRQQREKEEDERRRQAEATRAKMDAEIARRLAEVARQEEAARQAEQARKQEEDEARAKEKAAAQRAAVTPPAAAASAPTAVATAPAPAPAAPAVASATPAPAPVAAAPVPTVRPMSDAPRPGIGQAPRFPSQRPSAPGTGAPGGYQQRPGGLPGARPQGGGFDRTGAPGGDRGGPRPAGPGGYQPRPGGPNPAGPRPPFNRDGQQRPPFNRDGARPPFNREGAPGARPAGPGGDRRPGGPGGPGGDRRPGAFPPRTGGPGGDRRPGGPGGGREGFNRGGPPGARPAGGPPRVGPDGRPQRGADLQGFVDQGLQSDVSDDFRRTQARRGKPVKAGPEKEREKEGAWTEDAAAKARKGGKPSAADDAKKKIRPSQLFNVDAMNERRGKPRKRGPGERHDYAMPEPTGPKAVVFHGDFTVGEFSTRTGISITDVMTKLFGMGKMMTINQLLDPDTAEEMALDFEIEIRIEREGDEADIAEMMDEVDDAATLRPRAPVVTVMGHVDHGKTSLLDKIRKADVAAGEFGGITQHIGAYHVSTAKGDIVFLDTPGHEAFTEMRSRGANITDLVVLVVAANDGVMPQTVEAINHAKAAKVSILVAINKVDAPGANVERVKQELMKYELISEEYGGDTIMVPVSALTGHNIDTLLEYIALQTEILELKANPDRSAIGTIVESHVDPLRGATATVLVQRGTLRIGDIFVCGTEYGRVRAMRDDHDNPLEVAGPSTPVEILGLSGSPDAGEKLVVTNDEEEARDIAERRMQRRKKRSAVVKQHISLDNLAARIGEEDSLTLNIILKADVQGSLEAISQALMKIRSDKVFIKILHSAVGAVSASDVQLADASEAIILAFNVGIDTTARNLGEDLGVDIRKYQIIYALLEDIEKAMVGMLAPEFEEKEEGRAKVLQTFKVSKIGTIAGCFLEEGTIQNSHHARLLRGGSIIWRGKIKSLRRVKDDVKQVQSGLECGIGLENFNDVKEGDIIEFYSMVQQAVSLVSSDAVSKA